VDRFQKAYIPDEGFNSYKACAVCLIYITIKVNNLSIKFIVAYGISMLDSCTDGKDNEPKLSKIFITCNCK
jgi:hypothetical protein